MRGQFQSFAEKVLHTHNSNVCDNSKKERKVNHPPQTSPPHPTHLDVAVFSRPTLADPEIARERRHIPSATLVLHALDLVLWKRLTVRLPIKCFSPTTDGEFADKDWETNPLDDFGRIRALSELLEIGKQMLH